MDTLKLGVKEPRKDVAMPKSRAPYPERFQLVLPKACRGQGGNMKRYVAGFHPTYRHVLPMRTHSITHTMAR
ncbi:MAG: hypothetical protein DLM70_18760 [Chloroflexi bacterium]|nr:MAG: hypothetical protein DLM70_18760 [Chloroflexota bacterium]